MDVVTEGHALAAHRRPMRVGRVRSGHATPSRPAAGSLQVAMLAPPWISVPAPGYGGVESVVSALTESLVERGHEVTLYCAPGSVSGAHVKTLLGESHPDEIERSLYEVDHVVRALDHVVAGAHRGRFDVVHDHCGFTGLALADRIETPFVHTLHGPFTTSTAAFYAHPGHKAALVGISAAQLASAPPGLEALSVIPNPIDLTSWPLEERKEDYLLWVGRMTPEKGAASRDRRGARCRCAARAGGRHPTRAAGVLRPRDRPAPR